MPVSAARLLANRRNALKSSGPKSDEGKARSRRNAFKHGLTGEGVVLPEREASEVARRFEALVNEQKPSGEAGRIFLRRFAYLSVRLEKAEEFDASSTASRVRQAVAVFDDQRSTEVEMLVLNLASDPMTVARRLKTSPEGVDWLVKHWAELREDLMNTDRKAWTLNHWSRFEQLLGHHVGNVRISRPYALTQALSGYFVYLDDQDGAGLDEASRIEWARGEMARMIDDEVQRLIDLKATLNLDAIEQDRLEAPSRALFDPSPAMNLARKYEAATERAMYKALDQFHEVELAALEIEPGELVLVPDDPTPGLGSFLPGSKSDPELPAEPEGTAPRSAYLPEPRPSERIAARPVVVETGSKPRRDRRRRRDLASASASSGPPRPNQKL